MHNSKVSPRPLPPFFFYKLCSKDSIVAGGRDKFLPPPPKISACNYHLMS